MKNNVDLRVKIILLIIVNIWLFALIFIPILVDSMEEAGQYGDMFGTVNALFSGAALIYHICNYITKRRNRIAT